MEKVCLVIDDNDQQAVLEQLQEQARKKGISLTCLQFNVGSSKRKDLLTKDETIDMKAVVDIFTSDFSGTKIDLICIDYLLDDELVTGLDVLKAIHGLRKSSQFMLYSSSLDQLANSVINDYVKSEDKRQLFQRIKSLAKYKITEFVSRERYDQAILEILSHTPPNLDLILEAKLLEYPDLLFQDIYPAFEGLTPAQVAAEIRRGSHHGQTFKLELIEQAIAYMLKVNGK